ncbi:OTU domain-containing protein 5-like [Mytilus galloprovincialis]|uniref:OTU domain-containing protein 5-like n=1 Tax=Mytilus galloprovincialis TaxID=29158 RepID=UPI003F7C7D48
MTILPKKKPNKDKNETETADHSSMGHTHTTSENRHEKPSRGRNSPTRWLPSTSRDELLPGQDPGGSYEGFDASNSNKRRHRSSPHRSSRKHRQHNHQRSTPHAASSSSQANEYEETITGHNSDDEYVPPKCPDNIEELESWFETSLKEQKGFIIKKMGEDGACLFRAVADQIYGDQEMHGAVRKNCVDYMAKNADYFSHYVTEDFTTYLNRKRLDNCHGNHVEMQAICELFNRSIEVYQYSLEPINTFSCSYKTDNEPIRISYHQNTHYNSITDPYKATIGVGLGLPGFQPGLAEKNLMGDACQQSENTHIEKCMLEDKLKETDWEVTQETIEEQVARESYLQWLMDNQNRAKSHTSTRSASATCTSCLPSATCSSSCDLMYSDKPSSSEGRMGRSPRNRSNPNSQQNSPQQVDIPEHHSPKLSEQGRTGSPKTHPEVEAMEATVSIPQGAAGGAFSFDETSSLMNHQSSLLSGYQDWDEDDILAQVLAQSQHEYLDSLRKNSDLSPFNS